MGQTVDQRGPLVNKNKLQFNLSLSGSLTPEQLVSVEQNVCRSDLLKDPPMDNVVASLEDAQKMICSWCAIFGETYPAPVLVVAIATASIREMIILPQDKKWNLYSVKVRT